MAMAQKSLEVPIATDDLLSAILDIFTPAQALMLIDKLRQIKGLGYGRVTIVIHSGDLAQIQTQESFDFRSEEQ
jgi:hypothetical protein